MIKVRAQFPDRDFIKGRVVLLAGRLRALARGHGATPVAVSTSSQQTTFVVIAVAPAVSSLVVRRAGGSTVRVLPVRAGPARFCTFAVVKGG